MAILIGCEESQVICGAFRAAGFETYSCDILPTRGNPDWHYQGDIMEVLPLRRWDIAILHPDCTYMAVCNNRQAAKGKFNHHLRLRDIEWTKKLWNLAKAHSLRVALENPASVIFPHLRKIGAVVQYIHPYQHGHMEQKKTGLALHGLPKLTTTNDVYAEMMQLSVAERERVFYMPPGPNRARDRSETYSGISSAVVSQWGRLLHQELRF